MISLGIKSEIKVYTIPYSSIGNYYSKIKFISASFSVYIDTHTARPFLYWNRIWACEISWNIKEQKYDVKYPFVM